MLGNKIATKGLSANDCDTIESDNLEEVNDNINEGVDIKGKAGEDASVAESDSNSETTKKESDDHDLDKGFLASSAGSEGHNVTVENGKGEHTENNSTKVHAENAKLFADSKSDKSVINNLVTKKGGAKTD